VSQNSIHFGPNDRPGKPRLVLSFSMGKTSAYMTKLCRDRLADQYEMIVVTANTAWEREEALVFGNECDRRFGFNMVWVEAVTNPGDGNGTTHRVVTFETASRNGEPFEAMIQKYGIPGPGRAHCTRELKANAIRSYLRSIGWNKYTIAIGIRPDEPRRVDEEQMRRENLGEGVKFAYPLVDWFYSDKQDVNDWWEAQDFNLQLAEHEGNCAGCWKKSDPKLLLLARERPEVFTFPDRMEKLYPRVGAEFLKDPSAPDRVFFRKRRSAQALLTEAAASAQPVEVLRRFVRQDADQNSGCTESCEPYPMLNFGLEAA
jgi:3'-phosphoadenosine 5'-phosphosulfate sulfotransferase (PAPS reductase)/FAD synthetase